MDASFPRRQLQLATHRFPQPVQDALAHDDLAVEAIVVREADITYKRALKRSELYESAKAVSPARVFALVRVSS